MKQDFIEIAKTSPLSVICIGQHPDGSGKYIVKRTENLKQIDRIVSFHATYEDAKEAAKLAPNDEIRFSTGRSPVRKDGTCTEYRITNNK